MTGQESLELISRMISGARKDYYETGVSSLLWGSIITICSLVTFTNYYLRWPGSGIRVVPDYCRRRSPDSHLHPGKKARGFKSHDEDLMSGIWISFGISMFILSWVMAYINVQFQPPIYMVVYGIPTFTVGYGRRFKPMVIGGIACWVLAICAIFAAFPYVMLYMAAAAQLAWFIPGLILRKRYLKAKAQKKMFKDLNPILHSQLRLAVISILISVKEAEFTYLREKTESTAGNLSVQINKLKEAGYIDVEKTFKDNYPQTVCKITPRACRPSKST
ncbi:winged helix-turn-helix domain-containing protein [Puia sp. P3]|uniref:winged helix-turn-helix domain-containing protein n=1 Tax=Puia sp. P3 TaxID=3423952 RepID=UPI003D67C6B7